MRFKRAAVAMFVLAGWSLAAEEPKQSGAAPADDSGVFVDKDGKRKRLEKTPFGTTVRAADPAPEPARTLSDDPLLRVEQKGDTVTFRRKTPFGDQVWKKKRSELTAEEQGLLARQPAAKGAASKKAPAPAAAAGKNGKP